MVLNYPGLLTQPDARLRPTSHRRVVSGLGQHEVLNARQLVHDLSIVIHQLDTVFEMAAQQSRPPTRNKEGTTIYVRDGFPSIARMSRSASYNSARCGLAE